LSINIGIFKDSGPISSWPNYLSDDQVKICLENQDTSLIAKDISIYEDIGPESLNIPIFFDKNNKKNFICSSFAISRLSPT
jgi:hypothetical protein